MEEGEGAAGKPPAATLLQWGTHRQAFSWWLALRAN